MDSHDEYQYLSLVRNVITTGESRSDRTGTGTLSIFAPPNLRFSLSHNILPLITTKRTFIRGIIAELLWFIHGCTDSKLLSKKGVKIWDGNGSLEFLKARGLVDRREGDLGPVYGFQWRHFGADYRDCESSYSDEGVDQLADVIKKIRENPTDRRIILSAWNPKDIPLMALPPCHLLCQFHVSTPAPSDAVNHAKPVLSCLLFQRSADLGLGLPFNIASYALLVHMIAHVTGCAAGSLVIQLGDAHVYKTHVTALNTQLEREPKPFPTIRFRRSLAELLEEVALDASSCNVVRTSETNAVKSPDAPAQSNAVALDENVKYVRALEAITEDDILVEGYECWPAIKMEMSV